MGIETEKVTKEKASADEEKIKVDQINVEVSIKQTDCAADLKKAEPALIAAEQALNTLNKVAEKRRQILVKYKNSPDRQASLTELKSFGSPPPAVLMVTGAVMVLIDGQKGKIPKDRFSIFSASAFNCLPGHGQR